VNFSFCGLDVIKRALTTETFTLSILITITPVHHCTSLVTPHFFLSKRKTVKERNKIFLWSDVGGVARLRWHHHDKRHELLVATSIDAVVTAVDWF